MGSIHPHPYPLYPMGIRFCLITYPRVENPSHTPPLYRVIPVRYSGFGYPLSSLAWRFLVVKDGNGSGSDRVESPCTENQKPKSKPEPEPKTDSGGNPSPKPNRRIPETRTDTRNPNDTQNPRINIYIFTCINKRQQIINIFMSQF
jgi:hypothetical protein